MDMHVEVSVTDSGAGIRAEFLPYVFDRFKQENSRSTRRHGGLGIGLAIVKRLTELHGGTVSVYSAGEGLGSRFAFVLPLTNFNVRVSDTAVLRANAETKWQPPNLSGLRVLAVDDDRDAGQMIRRVLKECGAQTILAASAEEALSLLNSEFDVLISDIGMPDVDGIEFIKRVRRRSAKDGGLIPAIALTAFARTEDRHKAIIAGFDQYISKPVEPATLLRALTTSARNGRN
jgi:CheY-like chemotaxis protein